MRLSLYDEDISCGKDTKIKEEETKYGQSIGVV